MRYKKKTKRINSIFSNLFGILVLSICVASIKVYGQAPRLQTSKWFYNSQTTQAQTYSNTDTLAMYTFSARMGNDNISLYDSPFTDISLHNLSPAIIPGYAKENPSGYSYLCRLEQKVEQKMPVALWVRLGEIQPWESYNRQNIYLQFKLLGFR